MNEKKDSDINLHSGLNATYITPYGSQFTLGWVTRKTAIGNILQFLIIFLICFIFLVFKFPIILPFVIIYIFSVITYVIFVTFKKPDLLHDTGYLLGRKQAPLGDKRKNQLKEEQGTESIYQPIIHNKTISAKARIINPSVPSLGDNKI